MASTASSFLSPLLHTNRKSRFQFRRREVRVLAASEPSDEPTATTEKRKRRVDTRIHWDNMDEGWIGGKTKKETEGENGNGGKSQNKEDFLGRKFADLLSQASESHYQFLGVPVEADMEEIKAAYRRLSKEYHPDTTTLPLKSASEKFIRLREAYNILSNEERRRFYDWTLAQEAESRRIQQMRAKLEDPFEQDIINYEPVPDMVDRLGGRNMKLSDQALAALTIDIGIIFFCILCLIFVVVFKEPY
ncbi:chaperone DnaJ-domain superfamily protein [Carex rostrata]